MSCEAVSVPPAMLFKSKTSLSKQNVRKRLPSPESRGRVNESDTSGDEFTRPGVPAKRRRQSTKEAVSVTAQKDRAPTKLVSTTHQADHVISLTNTSDATKHADWFDEPRPRSTKGPARSLANVRITTITDFNASICKDYQKTGWCGFGDSCIYLHDRSEVKRGWELDREWENVNKGRKNIRGTVVADVNRTDETAGSDRDKTPESVPSVCLICNESYKSPVVTTCGHYFCEPCALTRYRKDPTCAACGSGTNGVFNSATRLKQLLKRQGAETARSS